MELCGDGEATWKWRSKRGVFKFSIDSSTTTHTAYSEFSHRNTQSEGWKKEAKKRVTLLKQFNQFGKVPLTVTTEAEANLMYLLGNDKIKSIARVCVFCAAACTYM